MFSGLNWPLSAPLQCIGMWREESRSRDEGGRGESAAVYVELQAR